MQLEKRAYISPIKNNKYAEHKISLKKSSNKYNCLNLKLLATAFHCSIQHIEKLNLADCIMMEISWSHRVSIPSTSCLNQLPADTPEAR